MHQTFSLKCNVEDIIKCNTYYYDQTKLNFSVLILNNRTIEVLSQHIFNKTRQSRYLTRK
jgi:hypothetical protein